MTAVAAPAAAQLPPVPTVQLPPVPTVQLPPVPSVVPTAVPTVVPTAVPTVTPPRLPSVPGVTPAAPSGGGGSSGGGGAPSGGGGSSGGGGAPSGGGASPSGGTSSGGGGASHSGGAPSGGGASSGRGSPSGGSTPASTERGASSGRGGSSKPSTRTQAARRDRKLRDAVLARQSCLSSLSRPERLVLTLRAGVGAGAPRTRGTVARRLRITVRRVTRLEHAGLKRLRAVCGVGAATTATTTTDSAAPPAPGSTLAQAPPDTKPTSKTGTPSHNATPAPSAESEGPDRGGVAGRSATNVPSPSEGGFQLWIPLLFLVCGVTGYFASRLLPARAGAAAAPASAPSGEHWSAPPAGGVNPPPAPAPLPAHKPPVDDPPPKLPSHRAPSHHRH